MLGLLFYGHPGCGKTSTIKAIANMTKRHIVSVPLKNINTASDLHSVFFGLKLNNRSVKINKRLYVLEDIDCGGLAKVVQRRKKDPEYSDENCDDSDSFGEYDKNQAEESMKSNQKQQFV